MSLLNDAINAAMREHNVAQVGATGSSNLAEALRRLLAPGSANAGASADAAHVEPDALEQLLARFQHAGFADVIRSWIGTGRNERIEPHELGKALGEDRVEDLSRESAVPRDTLLDELARLLPTVVDRLTPQGRLPERSSAHG